jgi:O-antigen/teichoic acid export membrane protein
MNEPSLKSKTIKGVGWSAADNLVKLGITFIVSVVLARLLSPDEYGLIGILTIFISLFNTVSDSGFSQALIRKTDANDLDYSTAFYTNLIISIFMAGVLFLCAPYIAHFFERNELINLTRVMSCIIIINAFCIVQRTITTKAINFKVQTKITFAAGIISGAIGIGMAMAGYGVWALVGQQISSQLTTALLFWYFNRWFPTLSFSSKSFYEMWTFGWKLLVSSILDTSWKEIFQVVIGKFYTPATLGLYTRAKQFADLCSSNLTSVVQRVSYPVLSSIQEDKIRLKFAYKRIIKTTMLPTFVLMLGMAACAKSMILVLIGAKWIDCVPILQIICTYGMLYPLSALNLNMLQVEGRSDLFLKLEFYKKIIAIGPLLLGIFVGLYWMLVGSFFSSLCAYYLNAYYSGPYLNYSIKEQIADILPSLGISLSMAIPVYLMSFISLSPYLLLPLQLVVGSLITIILCERAQLSEYNEFKEIVLKIRKKQNFYLSSDNESKITI